MDCFVFTGVVSEEKEEIRMPMIMIEPAPHGNC